MDKQTRRDKIQVKHTDNQCGARSGCSYESGEQSDLGAVHNVCNKDVKWSSLRPRGCWFEPHLCHCIVVLEQDTFILA